MLETHGTPADAVRELGIIVPAHNEAHRLDQTITRLWRHFGNRATLLIVANGCTDDTASVARLLARRYPTVELLDIAKQIGKGGAVRAGLTLGREPYVAFVDADGSTAPEQIDVLLQACIDRGVSGTIGSRWMRGSRIARKQPLRRRLASRVFNALTRVAFGLRYTDTQCGAKVFKRAAIDGILDKLEIANFAFDVDVLLLLKKIGKPVEEIPIAWEDVAEYSKVRLLRSGPPMLWALVRLFIRDSIFRRLPFLDILGLSETIPVRFGVDILFLVGPQQRLGAGTTELIEHLRQRGHTARVWRCDRISDVAAFATWYVRRGQRLSDVIVHGLGPLGSAVLEYSAKKKITFEDIEEAAGLPGDVCDRFIHNVATNANTALYFRRSGENWNLAAQRLEASAMER